MALYKHKSYVIYVLDESDCSPEEIYEKEELTETDEQIPK